MPPNNRYKMDLQTKHLYRKFGHCLIKWKIVNYHFLQLNNKWTICSPDFYVRGFWSTKWRMMLKVEGNVPDENRVSFRLERLACDSESDLESIWVDCLLFTEREGTRHVLKTFNSHFEATTVFEGEIQNTMQHLKSLNGENVLSFGCHLLIRFQNIAEKVVICKDEGIRMLSYNLENLYKTGRASDLILRVAGRSIPVHKAILCSQNNVLARLISAETSGKQLRYLDLKNIAFDFEALKNIIGFLYTSKFTYVLDKPTIYLYICASSLGIKPVSQYYEPDFLVLKTILKEEDFCFRWPINNVLSRKEEHFETPLLKDDTSDRTFRLKFFRKYCSVKNKTEQAAISADIFSKDPCNYACMDCALMSPDGNFDQKPKINVLERMGQEEHYVLELDRCDNLEKYLQGENLIVFFRLRTFASEQSISIVKSTNSFKPYNYELNYKIMLRNMEYLYLRQLFSDLHISRTPLSLKAQRCVVETRSPFLYQGIIKRNDLYEKNILLHRLLVFLYSGQVPRTVRSLFEFFKMYDIAKETEFPSLSIAIVETLKKHMSIEFAADIFKFADRRDIIDLALYTLYFVRDFQDSVLSSYRV